MSTVEFGAMSADELRDALVVLTRVATDTGVRVGLDEAITALGFSRPELETEMEQELGHGW
jgi:hypothetical protein